MQDEAAGSGLGGKAQAGSYAQLELKAGGRPGCLSHGKLEVILWRTVTVTVQRTCTALSASARGVGSLPGHTGLKLIINSKIDLECARGAALPRVGGTSLPPGPPLIIVGSRWVLATAAAACRRPAA